MVVMPSVHSIISETDGMKFNTDSRFTPCAKRTDRDMVPPIPLERLLMTGESSSIFKCLPALRSDRKR